MLFASLKPLLHQSTPATNFVPLHKISFWIFCNASKLKGLFKTKNLLHKCHGRFRLRMRNSFFALSVSPYFQWTYIKLKQCLDLSCFYFQDFRWSKLSIYTPNFLLHICDISSIIYAYLTTFSSIL